MRSSGWWWALAVACGGDETHPCDAGTPTCDSSLIVYLPDDRDVFTVTVGLDGTDVVATCPSPGGDQQVGEYTVSCGAGQVTLRTNLPFPDELTVRLEEAPPSTFEPQYQRGGDFCGNPCTLGSVQL
jgi:hypothetical protein